jgi:hypothetical protein
VSGIDGEAVHSQDVGDAYRLAVKRDVRGAFNIAIGSVLDALEISRLVDVPRFVANSKRER